MNYTKFDQYLGNALFEARVVKRITQDDMKKEITRRLIAEDGRKKGISRQAYSLYEKGERSMPDNIFTYACDYLGLDEIKVFNDACEYIKKKED